MRKARAILSLLCLAAACLALSPSALHAQSAPASSAAIAQYRQALEAYMKAQQAYAAAASAYWSSITAKRQSRNSKRANGQPLAIEDYVLEQPPVYSGPPKPQNPALPPQPPKPPPYVPVVSDFLAAAQQEFKFAPRQPRNESEYKAAYAKVAAANGLSKDQAVRVYAFEATGNGGYDIQAGQEYNKHARAITTALGYNQLLATNSVEIIAETGDQFVKALTAAAALLPDDQKRALLGKVEIIHRMIAFTRTVPDAWDQHDTLAATPRGLGVHALNLDVDVGPLLQTQKLMDSVVFAHRKGYGQTLTAAELEMMNLTGDGNGFDMVTMPAPWRDKVPTANFFRQSGYADNPVAQRNNVVAKLIAATDAQMNQESKKAGARELAAAFR